MHATRPAGKAHPTGTCGKEVCSRPGGPSRRHFLKQLSVGAAGLGLLAPSALATQGGETPGSEGPLEPTSDPQSVLVIGASLNGGRAPRNGQPVVLFQSGGFETIDIWGTAFAQAVAMAEKQGHPSLKAFCANLTQVTKEIE